MKILLISCHQVLEASEARILKSLGHSVQTIGFYATKTPQTNMRNDPGSDKDEEFLAKFDYYNPQGYVLPSLHPQSGMCNLPDDLIKDFDLIILHYYPWMLTHNWPSFSKKSLLIRTIGFPVNIIEQHYLWAKHNKPNTKIVRLSDTESLNPYYCGADAIIPQTFHPEDFTDWVGNKEQILTVTKMFKKRADSCKFAEYEQITEPFKDKRVLIGSQNEDIPYAKVEIPLSELRQDMSESRICLNMPSQPACCTYSLVEAMGIGMPIVSVGPKIGDCNGQHTFNIEKYIDNGESGFIGDSVEECQEHIRTLLNDFSLCQKLGAKAKEKAKSMFHVDVTTEQWRQVLETL